MMKIIYNGKVYLEREKFTQALLIDEGRIIKTGSSQDILEMAPANAEKIDADDALVLPAFHDSHLHLMWTGRREAGIECDGAKSIEEIIRRGKETIDRLKPASGACVQGAGINPDLFCEGEKRDPCREDLDKISADHPLVIRRHCGHTMYCNSYALKLAGISDSAPDIKGGVVEKDKSGRPTGVLRENAMDLIRKTVTVMSVKDMKNYLRLGMKKAHSMGITTCGSYDTDGTNFDKVVEAYCGIYDEYKEAGMPGLRVNMQCGISAREDLLDEYIKRKKTDDSPCIPLREDPQWGPLPLLKIQSIKLFVDGTLGAHTAWMRQPYRDNPETSEPLTRGFPLIEQELLNRLVKKAAAAGMQVLVHAIGDAGMDAVLQAFEKVTCPGNNPLRHGIVHCQITSPDLLERMARNKILALVQPAFLANDIHILESRVGAQLASTSYAWGSMQRLDIPVSYSTDAPVSPLNPLFNIEWAILRRNSENPHSAAFYPNEKVDIYSTVDAYTKASAYSSFDEGFLGRIEPACTGGQAMSADLVFLDRDIFTIPPEDIHKARVLRTICAGETVFRAR